MPGKVVSAIWGRRELACGLAFTCLDLSCLTSCSVPPTPGLIPARAAPSSPFCKRVIWPGPGPGELRRPCAPLSKRVALARCFLGWEAACSAQGCRRPRLLLLSCGQVLDSSRGSPGSPSPLPSLNVWGQQQAQGPWRKPCRVCVRKLVPGLRESAQDLHKHHLSPWLPMLRWP